VVSSVNVQFIIGDLDSLAEYVKYMRGLDGTRFVILEGEIARWSISRCTSFTTVSRK